MSTYVFPELVYHIFFVFWIVYALLGFGLLIMNRESIIIQNRRPNLLLIDQLSVFINGFMCISVLESVMVFKMSYSCLLFQIVMGTSSVITLILLMARTTFVYSSLMPKTARFQFGMKYLTDYFWDDNHNLRKKVVIRSILFWVIVSTLNILIAGLYTNTLSKTVNNECSADTIIVLTLFNFVFMAALIFLSIQFLIYKVRDHIWMSYEFSLFSITLVICMIPYMYLNNGFDIYGIIIEAVVCSFYGLYFPLFAKWHHDRKIKRTISQTSLVNDQIMDLCKKFYCEENGLFVTQYEKYKQNVITADYLITMFIELNAPFELNINYDLRMSVLSSNEELRMIYLEQVHDHIKLIIRENILPYMEKDAVY